MHQGDVRTLIFLGGGWLRPKPWSPTPLLRPTSPAQKRDIPPVPTGRQASRILIAHQQAIEMLLS